MFVGFPYGYDGCTCDGRTRVECIVSVTLKFCVVSHYQNRRDSAESCVQGYRGLRGDFDF